MNRRARVPCNAVNWDHLKQRQRVLWHRVTSQFHCLLEPVVHRVLDVAISVTAFDSGLTDSVDASARRGRLSTISQERIVGRRSAIALTDFRSMGYVPTVSLQFTALGAMAAWGHAERPSVTLVTQNFPKAHPVWSWDGPITSRKRPPASSSSALACGASQRR